VGLGVFVGAAAVEKALNVNARWFPPEDHITVSLAVKPLTTMEIILPAYEGSSPGDGSICRKNVPEAKVEVRSRTLPSIIP
jgi:hypothetical protein